MYNEAIKTTNKIISDKVFFQLCLIKEMNFA